MYELFEHTADIGIRVRSAGLEGLFEDAARGLFSVIVADLRTVRPVEEVCLRIQADGWDHLLFDWLTELLYTFETRRLLLSDFQVHLESGGLKGLARGEPIDRARHRLEREVKAITYHGLRVEREQQGWVAELIVDI